VNNDSGESLPAGWVEASLSECAVRITKGTTPTSLGHAYRESGIPFIRVENLANGRIASDTLSAYIDTATHDALARSQLESGDLLFSIAGTIGRVALVQDQDVPANTNQALAIIRGTDVLMEAKYLQYALSSFSIQRKALDGARGGAMSNISLADVGGIVVRIPPRCEQRRIVAEIQKQTSRLDHAIDFLGTVEMNLASASRAILQKTCEHPELLSTNRCVGDVSECLDRQRVPVNAEERKKRGGSVPYFGANGQVGWIDKPIFNEPLVLVVEDETFVGRTKPFAYRIEGPSWVNNHAHILRPNADISLQYLHYALMYYPFTPLTTGSTGRRKLTQKALMEAPLYLPNREEQHRRVESLDRWFSIAEQLSKSIATATQRAASLRQAILKKAFEGKLVPQDPNDEPASVLLERIRAARAPSSTALMRYAKKRSTTR
jgi:type I restriction enzyme S subunit